MKPELGADGGDLSGLPEVGGPFVAGRSQSGPNVAEQRDELAPSHARPRQPEDCTLPHPPGNAALCITAIFGAKDRCGSFATDPAGPAYHLMSALTLKATR